MVLDRLHRVWKVHWIMLPLPRLHQRNKHVESIALRRVTLRDHKALDLFEDLAVIALALDWRNFHDCYPSNGLRIDPVVLPMRADEPDIDDAIRIIDPHHDAILVAGDVEHRATVVENARAADGSLRVRRRRPVSSPDLPVPGHQWFARVGVHGASADESLKRQSNWCGLTRPNDGKAIAA